MLQYEFGKLALESGGFGREIASLGTYDEIVNDKTCLVCGRIER